MNKNSNIPISGRLRACRIASELSQADVAKGLAISRQAVSAWERGAAMPTVLQLCEVGLLYGASADFILYGVKTAPVSDLPMMSEIFRTRLEPEAKG